MKGRILNTIILGAAISLATPDFCMAQTASPDNRYSRYHGDGIDNVLEYVPTVTMFGLKAAGVRSSSTWQQQLASAAAAFAVTAGTTYALKHTIHKMRPDGTDNRSFPSGHTAVAFCGATMLMHEYHGVSPWIGVAGYAVATGVAADRVRRNRHHWGDVAVGAAVGVLSAEAGYWIGSLIIGKNRKNNDMSLSIAPTGVAFCIRP